CNNFGSLPVRVIYRFPEPDPRVKDAERLKVETASYYRFAPNARFDAEAIVADGGRVLVIAKQHDGRDAEIFAVPFDPPAPLVRPALPERIGSLEGFVEPVTGADLSADGLRLAVCGCGIARVYVRMGTEAEARWTWSLKRTWRVPDPTTEGICWDGDDLVLVGE